MTNDERSPNDEDVLARQDVMLCVLRASDFVIPSSLGISSFVISLGPDLLSGWPRTTI
jgi:hypothetical protein